MLVKSTPATHAKRSQAVYDIVGDIDRTYPIDILVYTPQEIQQRLAIRDSFIQRILSDGKVLYAA